MNIELISQEPAKLAHPTPVLFAHGAWHGAWCWEEYFMPYFAGQGYRTFALSYRGHGGSEGRANLLRSLSRDYVADLAQAADDVERQTGQRPIVVSHSLGGYVTQKFLENHKVPAAVLLASIPSHGALPFFLRFMLRHPAQFFHSMFTLNGYYIVGSVELTREAFFSADMPDEKVRAYFGKMIPESFLAGLEACLNLPRTSKVTTPVLVLAAKNDRVFMVSEERSTARAYHGEAEIFEGMAHDMMLEKDWQKVADRIIGWLGEREIS